MPKKLSKGMQDQIVVELVTSMETMDSDEFEELYSQLDIDHQMDVDQSIREFANNAIGSEHWDSDD